MDAPRNEVIARTGPGTDSRRGTAGPTAWAPVAQQLREGAGTSWLSVRNGRGGVHTRPVFAAWGGSSFLLATKATAVKTGLLQAFPEVSLAVDLGTTHLVVEGEAARLRAPDDLRRASAAMLEVYDWPTEVVGDELDAPYAAPTSGGPPFQAWEITPRRAHAFPTEDQYQPTRFAFDAPGLG
ncbi:hypothetical protein [uncultured Nocardioides sp.]|uniref:hypothetical protein n=1 Tax=uncultured Nocardioides sp. TaxID=198441 RepID=UPI002621D811|nr:hypothetical protein [uncultured Nocardioides sp.]